MPPSIAIGAASKLSAPRDFQDDNMDNSCKSILITPSSGVATYAMPYRVTTSLMKSESKPSCSVIISESVIEDVFTKDSPSSE